MNEDSREQVRVMLLDIVENMETPSDFEGSDQDFRREWMNTLVDVTQEEIRNLN